MEISIEKDSDYFEVEKIIRESFWNVYKPGCDEHFIVHKLRDDDSFVKNLSFVIKEDNKIIGSIFYFKGNLKLNGKIKSALSFGPVCILPEYQNKGYGFKLIEYSLNKAFKQDYDYIIITGDYDYYKKFGFEKASKYNIFDSEKSPFLLIKFFNISSNDEGLYYPPDLFYVDEKELEEFDKKFI